MARRKSEQKALYWQAAVSRQAESGLSIRQFCLREGISQGSFYFRHPTDMRKSFHGLVALVESALRQDPLSGSLFVFVNRRRDRMKILYWGQTGFCI